MNRLRARLRVAKRALRPTTRIEDLNLDAELDMQSESVFSEFSFFDKVGRFHGQTSNGDGI